MSEMDWNVDKYKEVSETEEQWNLRRAFMLKWKNDFPEDRLVCLSRLFINIEFMGCRYSAKVQDLIAELSREIIQEYRESKKNRLSRYFVSASSAAKDYVKRPSNTNVKGPPQKIAFISAGQTVDVEPSVANITVSPENSKDESSPVVQPVENPIQPQIHDLDTKLQSPIQPLTKSNSIFDVQTVNARAYHPRMLNTPYGKMVLLGRVWCSDHENLIGTVKQFNLNVNFTEEAGKCAIILNGAFLASGTGLSKAEAKSDATSNAWKVLSSKCVTLVHKKVYTAAENNEVKGSDLINTKSQRKASEAEFGVPVESSVASKMMKLMGWSGGSLGTTNTGITEPIMPHTQQVHRAGLGSDGSKSGDRQFNQVARSLLQRFASSHTSSVTDLIFSNDFSKEERALLHTAARTVKLNSRSYGKDADRFLVIRKRLDPFLVVEEVVRSGGSTEKYSIIIPQSLVK